MLMQPPLKSDFLKTPVGAKKNSKQTMFLVGGALRGLVRQQVQEARGEVRVRREVLQEEASDRSRQCLREGLL